MLNYSIGHRASYPFNKSRGKRVNTIKEQQVNISQIRQLVTDDFLSSLDSADLFTRAIIGNSYEYVRVALRKEDDEKSPLLVWVKRGSLLMSWFARTYFSSILIGETPLGRMLLEENKLPASFTVTGFEATEDFYGNPFYSRRIVDMSKVRANLNGVFQTWADRNASNEERGIANAELRANILKVVQDRFLKDGKITQEAEEKYRLGKITIEVSDYITE